ncbi:MAG: hypothetical protein HYR85_22465 [Planctomycetes bacterium]|nr:hypothetical protein [Planctomycetota bacterium]
MVAMLGAALGADVRINVMMGLLLAAVLGGDVSIEIQTDHNAVFARKIANYIFAVRSPRRFEGRLTWKLVVSGRTVSRGEKALSAVADGSTAIDVPVAIPMLTEGVALPATMFASVAESGSDEAVASAERSIWIFGDDPFAGRREWLRDLGLALFDPSRTTREAFDALGIPYSRLADVRSISRVAAGRVIVGEGVALDAHPGLASAIDDCVERGVPVLVLAPRSGSLALPRPDDLRLRGPGVVSDLDDRLDSVGWLPDGATSSSTLRLRSDETSTTIEATPGARGWAWCEARYGAGKGRVIVCSLALIEAWESEPSPRYFFARLLEMKVKP